MSAVGLADVAAVTRSRRAHAIASLVSDQVVELLGPEIEAIQKRLEGVQAARQDVEQGWQDLVYGSQPASGAEYVYTVTASSLFPLSVMCRLTCSAVAGERRPVLEYRDANGSRYVSAGADVGLAALQVGSFNWLPGSGPGAWPVDDTADLQLPQQLLRYGYQLVVRVAGMDAADQLDQVRISGLFARGNG